MKKSIFDEQTSKALKQWRMAVKKKQVGKSGRSPTRTLGGTGISPTPSMPSSPMNSTGATLHRFKTTGHSTRSVAYEDPETSDLEADPSSHESQTTQLIVRIDHDETDIETSGSHSGEETKKDDFSFVKPAPPK